MSWLFAGAVGIGAAMIVATALPLLRKSAWWIRVLDFPRLQITALAAAALAIFLALRDPSSAWQSAFAALLGAARMIERVHVRRPPDHPGQGSKPCCMSRWRCSRGWGSAASDPRCRISDRLAGLPRSRGPASRWLFTPSRVLTRGQRRI